MDRLHRLKMEGMTNEDILSIYTEYVRDSIEKDLRKIYEEEIYPVDSEEPWVFKVKEK